MYVLDLDLDAAIGNVSRLPDPLRRGLDHLPRRKLLQFPGGRSVVRGSLGQIGMERPLHAGGVAIEPALEVVERHAHDRVAISHLGFFLSHARTIAAISRTNTFQLEVGFANLAVGILGTVAMGRAMASVIRLTLHLCERASRPITTALAPMHWEARLYS